MTKLNTMAILVGSKAAAKQSKGKAKRAVKAADAAKPSAKRAKKAPGDSTALRAKANDNLAAQAKRKGKAVTVTSTTAMQGGDGTYVTFSDNSGLTLAQHQFGKATQQLLKAKPCLKDDLLAHLATLPKPNAQLARGVTAKDAPNSAKAVQDQKSVKSAKPAAKGKAQAKAPKAAKAKAGSDYSYKPTKKANEAKAGSLRQRMLAVIMAHKDTASAKAAASKAKLPGLNSGWFNWAAANGYITK